MIGAVDSVWVHSNQRIGLIGHLCLFRYSPTSFICSPWAHFWEHVPSFTQMSMWRISSFLWLTGNYSLLLQRNFELFCGLMPLFNARVILATVLAQWKLRITESNCWTSDRIVRTFVWEMVGQGHWFNGRSLVQFWQGLYMILHTPFAGLFSNDWPNG